MHTCLSVSNLAVCTLGRGSSHCSKHLRVGVLFGGSQERQVGSLWGEKHICTFPKVYLAFMYTSSEKCPQTAFWKLTLLTWLPKSLWSHRTTWKKACSQSWDRKINTHRPWRETPASELQSSVCQTEEADWCPGPLSPSRSLQIGFLSSALLFQKAMGMLLMHVHISSQPEHMQSSLNWATCRALWSSRILNYS